MEVRCTPGALLGDPPAPALAADTGSHAVPISLTAHIVGDGSGGLDLSGTGSHLGRWTGHGAVDSVVVDAAANRLAVTATATLTAANGDQLFVSISVSVNLATGVADEAVTLTGGTGRFAGASGSVSAVYEATVDPASPLAFECTSQGSGTLVLAHPG
jgi:hypothetical protein